MHRCMAGGKCLLGCDFGSAAAAAASQRLRTLPAYERARVPLLPSPSCRAQHSARTHSAAQSGPAASPTPCTSSQLRACRARPEKAGGGGSATCLLSLPVCGSVHRQLRQQRILQQTPAQAAGPTTTCTRQHRAAAGGVLGWQPGARVNGGGCQAHESTAAAAAAAARLWPSCGQVGSGPATQAGDCHPTAAHGTPHTCRAQARRPPRRRCTAARAAAGPAAAAAAAIGAATEQRDGQRRGR